MSGSEQMWYIQVMSFMKKRKSYFVLSDNFKLSLKITFSKELNFQSDITPLYLLPELGNFLCVGGLKYDKDKYITDL